MQPSAEQFSEWMQHPVTEWVFAACLKHAGALKGVWAGQVWESGEINPQALLEARVRADCYRALPESSFEDWKAIDDTEA